MVKDESLFHTTFTNDVICYFMVVVPLSIGHTRKLTILER